MKIIMLPPVSPWSLLAQNVTLAKKETGKSLQIYRKGPPPHKNKSTHTKKQFQNKKGLFVTFLHKHKGKYK